VTFSDVDLNYTELYFKHHLGEGMYRFWRITYEGMSSAFDTYRFWENMTVEVTVIGVTDTLNYSIFLGEMTFRNYFSPTLGDISVSGAGLEKRVWWSCSDRNLQDEHFFEILLSADSGESYQLLRRNLTETQFIWDSTGFIGQSYIFKVRAKDNDPLRNPDALHSGIFWPGLNDSRTSWPFTAGSPMSGGPPVTTTTPIPTTNPPPDTGHPLVILQLVIVTCVIIVVGVPIVILVKDSMK
jgi:hypothetical protein